MRKTFFSLWLSCAITLASVSAQVVINEMLYDSEPDSQALEFVELFNPGGLAVDLSGWRFTDGIDFTFTNGTQIAAFGFLLVAQDPATLSAVYGAMAEGPWSGSLKNAGEKVTLRDAAGNKIDEVDYQRAFPWPTCPGVDQRIPRQQYRGLVAKLTEPGDRYAGDLSRAGAKRLALFQGQRGGLQSRGCLACPGLCRGRELVHRADTGRIR